MSGQIPCEYMQVIKKYTVSGVQRCIPSRIPSAGTKCARVFCAPVRGTARTRVVPPPHQPPRARRPQRRAPPPPDAPPSILTAAEQLNRFNDRTELQRGRCHVRSASTSTYSTMTFVYSSIALTGKCALPVPQSPAFASRAPRAASASRTCRSLAPSPLPVGSPRAPCDSPSRCVFTILTRHYEKNESMQIQSTMCSRT